VPTDSVPAVNHDHADVGMIDQSVRERHSHRTGADHEVIGFQLSPCHRLILSARPERVNGRQARSGGGRGPGRNVVSWRLMVG
jgi:hypothetical protein